MENLEFYETTSYGDGKHYNDDTIHISSSLPGTYTNYDTVINGTKRKIRNLPSISFSYDNPGLEDDNSKNRAKQNLQSEPQMDSIDAVPRDYDPHDFGNVDKPTTFWGTVFHLTFLSAGPGILYIPSTFATLGAIYGSLLTFVLIFFYVYNVRLIVWSEYELCKLRRVPRLTYPEAVFYAFEMSPKAIRWLAPYMRWCLYVVFVGGWWAGCAYSNNLISQTLLISYKYWFQSTTEVREILVFLLVPMVALGLIRKLSFLVPLSILGLTLNYLSLFIVVYYVITDSNDWEMDITIKSFSSVPLFIGSILFWVNLTALVIPLKSEMAHPKKFGSLFGVLTISYIFIGVAMIVFSLLCCLKYGKSIHTIIFKNLPQDEPLAQLAILCYAFALMFMYPLVLYVSFDVIWNNILKGSKFTQSVFREYVVRAVIGVLIFGFSYAIPNMDFYLLLSGTVGTAIDSVIFPNIFQMLVTRNVYEYREKYNCIFFKNIVLIGIGCLLVVGGFFDALEELQEGF